MNRRFRLAIGLVLGLAIAPFALDAATAFIEAVRVRVTKSLEVNGSFKYTDGNQGAGRVLASDAGGNASWATPIPTATAGAGSGTVVGTATPLQVAFWVGANQVAGDPNWTFDPNTDTVVLSGYEVIRDGTESAGRFRMSTGGSSPDVWVTPVPTATAIPTPTPGAGGAANAVDTITGMTAGRVAIAVDPNTIETYSQFTHDTTTHRTDITADHSSTAAILGLHAASSGVGASLCLDANDPNGVDVRWGVLASQSGPFVVRRACGSGAGDGSDDIIRATSAGDLQLRQITTPAAPADPNWTTIYAKDTGIFYRPYGGSETQLSGNGGLTVTSATGETLARLRATAHLHFDGTNGSTTFTDEVGATWTASGNASLTTTSPKFGTACATFDGTTDYVTSPMVRGLELADSDFTIEVWIKVANTNTIAYSTILGRSRDSGTAFANPSWVLLINNVTANGRVAFWVAEYNTGAAMLAMSSGDLRDSTWHHVAVTRKNALWTLWIDGASAATATWGSRVTRGTRGFYIGGDIAQSGHDFKGEMDELRIEIGNALYTAAFTPSASAFSAPLGAVPMHWASSGSLIYSGTGTGLTP